jgi:hypothetical protein
MATVCSFKKIFFFALPIRGPQRNEEINFARRSNIFCLFAEIYLNVGQDF